MKIKRSFAFAFDDANAIRKLLKGGVCLFLFFTVYFFFVVIGYVMRILYAALEGRDAGLPKWETPNALFNEGLLPVLVLLAYSAPLIALLIAEQMLYAVIGSSAQIANVIAVLSLVVGLAVSFVLPLGLIRLVIHGSLGQAFNLAQILDFVWANPRNHLTAWAVSVLIAAASLVLGFVLVVVGVFFTSFFAMVVVVHLYAQAYRNSTPFKDDKEGKIRSSRTIPPPLTAKTNQGNG